MRKCREFEDAIWQHAGGALPPELQRHIAECPKCSQALAEAAEILKLMPKAAVTPSSPDCRSAVMERVLGRRRRPVWVYAMASILIVAVAVTGYISFRPKPHKTAPPIVQTMPTKRATPKQKNPPIVVREHAPSVIAAKPGPTIRQPVRKHRMLVQNPVPKETPPQPVSSPAEKERPVAAVAVTWEAPGVQSSDSYAYVKTDPETGETTACRVQRSDGSVTIFLECKPSGDEPPEKGA